jgi:acetylornithine deacetylase/succinyl-diaminopimelate desuccinylase-like protein
MWGGPLADPVQALSKIIASVTDKNGRLAIPGIYSKVRKLTATEQRSLKSLRYTEKEYRRQSGVLPKTMLLGDKKELLKQVWYEPSYSVNAIQASSRKDCANIINEAAWCHMGIRIVPDMDPKDVLKRLKAHLLKNAPWGAQVEFSNENLSPAWTTAPEGPVFEAAARALKSGYGREPVFIGCGGSIPFVGPFANALGGAPALLIGVEDPMTNPHSENESLHIPDFKKAILSAVYLYDELAGLKPGSKTKKIPASNSSRSELAAAA